MSASDKMRAEFESWASEQFLSIERLPAHVTVFDGQYASLDTQEAWTAWQAAYAAGRKAEQAEVDCKTEKLLAEFRIFIEEVERTGIYYDNAIVGTALANAWRVFDDIAARIRGKPEGER